MSKRLLCILSGVNSYVAALAGGPTIADGVLLTGAVVKDAILLVGAGGPMKGAGGPINFCVLDAAEEGVFP